MRVAHFVHRYPPALGGAEAYFARLGRWLAASGDDVTVFTTDALDLEAMHSPAGRRTPPGTTREDGVEVKAWRFSGAGLILPLRRGPGKRRPSEGRAITRPGSACGRWRWNAGRRPWATAPDR